MPEGDVVFRTARRLDAALRGLPLTVTDLRWPSVATVDLTGRPVAEVVSLGKHLLIRVTGDGVPTTVHSHLRMEGTWFVHATGERPRLPGRGDQIRAVLANRLRTAVGLRLGMLDVVATDREATLVGHLGPDPLRPGWQDDDVAVRLVAAPERPIGEVLLDQSVLAGVGTFYLAEALFLRGVSPWTPAGQLDGEPAVALSRTVRRLLTANAGREITATTGDLHQGRRQWVHARSGHPCRRCGTPIRVAPIGTAPQDRVAFYCPHCQPGPTPTDSGRPARPLGATPPGYGPANH